MSKLDLKSFEGVVPLVLKSLLHVSQKEEESLEPACLVLMHDPLIIMLSLSHIQVGHIHLT